MSERLWHDFWADRSESHPAGPYPQTPFESAWYHAVNKRILAFEQRLLPRIYALGENAWGGERDYADFLSRVREYIAQANERGLSCLSVEQADPEGEAKKAEMMAYMAAMQTSMSPEMREQAVKFTKPNKEFEARFMREFFGREPE